MKITSLSCKLLMTYLTLFIFTTIKAQLSVGLESGITFSNLTNLDGVKSFNRNKTYEVTNLNNLNGHLTLKYQFLKKFVVGLSYGSTITGFREIAVNYSNEHFSQPEKIEKGKASNGAYLSDFTYDSKFNYIDINMSVGYLLTKRTKIYLGFSFLKVPNMEEATHLESTLTRYQAFLSVDKNDFPTGVTKVRALNISSSESDPSRIYNDDRAIVIGMEHEIYKGLYLSISYLKGFKKILNFPSDIETYNQALNFNIGYQWTLKKHSKY